MSDVLRFCDCDQSSLIKLVQQLGMQIQLIERGRDIPGSFWGDEEAGLIGNALYVRMDTPVHSVLHEACHFVCMDDERRAKLHTDAGGNADEENAVCYLEILLAEALPDMGQDRIFRDTVSYTHLTLPTNREE